MTLAEAKARANKTFIVQASLTIITYNHQKIFTVQARKKEKLQIVKKIHDLLDYVRNKCHFQTH